MPVTTAEPKGARKFTYVFSLLLLAQALGAYAIGPVPIPWFAQTGVVALFFWLFARRQVRLFPGFSVVMVFLIWAIGTTLTNMMLEDYSLYLPPKATTPYLVYVGLRFINLLSFASAVGVTYWLLQRNQANLLIRNLTIIGGIVALYAGYVYVAQLKGWPELPRTRVGTSGEEQLTVFTYAFHRAMGSFREPSHLAQWLVLPIFMSLSIKGWRGLVASLLMGAMMLLSGSLTGILSTMVGLLGAAAFNVRRLIPEIKKISRILVPLAVASVIFSLMVSRNIEGTTNLVEVIWTRIAPVLTEKGAESTNRDYVYKYMEENPAPVWGYGLGHSNLLFSRANQLDATASFLNLYINVAYSLGVVGLLMLALLLAFPFYLYIVTRSRTGRPRVFFLLGAYLAWLLIYFVHSEELNIHFGIIYAMAVYFFGLRDWRGIMEEKESASF
ncbi:MAG: O-antigen ligase family protein [Bdellovibrionaceae bacterium]|nr:O-antigen ligase family protein [Bdellovibrionales bacterium]MCB9084611.1 O-antigen ligase family protein [Pseudobdellovibrionaceae bacterium]